MTKQALTKSMQRDLADSIASKHGCEILPAAFGGTAIQVHRRYSQGSPLDDRKVAACRKEIEASGVSTKGWLS
jgi:hypothetical protein